MWQWCTECVHQVGITKWAISTIISTKISTITQKKGTGRYRQTFDNFKSKRTFVSATVVPWRYRVCNTESVLLAALIRKLLLERFPWVMHRSESDFRSAADDSVRRCWMDRMRNFIWNYRERETPELTQTLWDRQKRPKSWDSETFFWNSKIECKKIICQMVQKAHSICFRDLNDLNAIWPQMEERARWWRERNWTTRVLTCFVCILVHLGSLN